MPASVSAGDASPGVTPIAVLDSVTCAFGPVIALDSITLAVPPGQIHAILGPNGAGKTTLLRVLSGLQWPAAGTVTVGGMPPRLGRRGTNGTTGVVPANSRSFYLRLSGYENLLFVARLHGLSRAHATARVRECLADVGLADAGGRPVGSYSHGMQRRLAVARAFLTRPSLLVLDEATHDLDPAGARLVCSMVREAARAGTAVVWATQRLDEIRGFAHRVTVLHEGRVRFSGTLPELTALTTTQRFLLRTRQGEVDDERRWNRLVEAVGPAGTVEATADDEHVVLNLHDHVVLGDVIAAIGQSGIQVLGCREEQSVVEVALLRLTEPAPMDAAGVTT